jgi:hypothetical protein
MENSHLMSESQHLQFEGGPTPKPEGDQRNHCPQDGKHAGHAKPMGAKLQCLRSIRNYEQRQGQFYFGDPTTKVGQYSTGVVGSSSLAPLPIRALTRHTVKSRPGAVR